MNEKAVAAMKEFLEALGLDLEKEGMEKTPYRVTALYEKVLSGRTESAKEVWGEIFPTDTKGLVSIGPIPFYTLCEHHLVPVYGKMWIVYEPKDGRVAGLSKFIDVLAIYARRPQLQERLTRQIGEAVMEGLQAKGVVVIAEAEHLCMVMHGDAAPGTIVKTMEVLGSFASSTALRQEALLLIGKGASYDTKESVSI